MILAAHPDQYISQVPGLTAGGDGGSCTLYDVHARKSLGKSGGGGYTAKGIGSRDSVFLTLSC